MPKSPTRAPRVPKRPATKRKPVKKKAPVASPRQIAGKKRDRSTAADARSRARAEAVALAGLAKKAEDVLVIDVRGLTSIAEYFVLLTGASSPQLRAIAESIEQEIKKQNVAPLSIEGRGSGWVLLDYGDVVVHIFDPEVRRFYDLEGLWADAPRERITG